MFSAILSFSEFFLYHNTITNNFHYQDSSLDYSGTIKMERRGAGKSDADVNAVCK